MTKLYCKLCLSRSKGQHKDKCIIITDEALRVSLKSGLIREIENKDKFLITLTEKGESYIDTYERDKRSNLMQSYRCIYYLLKSGDSCRREKN